MPLAKRVLRALPLLLVSPLLFALAALAMLAADLVWFVAGRRASAASPDRPPETMVCPTAASVVIPNWNGAICWRSTCPRWWPRWPAIRPTKSWWWITAPTDGSAEFVRTTFPQVKLVALEKNLGFGGGSNAGFRAAANDIVVLLNSDMRVAEGFPGAAARRLRDPLVFAVSCQIFFSDPAKLREETGLTQGWWQDGGSACAIASIPQVDCTLFPCFYGGGGSCAFDRRKFLELGGFDQLLAPFYLEDTDLGYMAWKRGWKVLYQPRSVVYHEHRGTIGKRFSEDHIQAVLKKNYLLFCWKNIHEWPRLLSHLASSLGGRVAERGLRRRSPASQFGGCVAGLPPIAWRGKIPLARPLAGRHRRRRGFPPSHGRLLPRSLRAHGSRPGTPARAVRLSLSHQPSHPRRRGLHVPDFGGARPSGRNARGGNAGLALAGSGQSQAGGILRLVGVDSPVPPAAPAARHRSRRTPCANSATTISNG
jgi:GT2 family glycosyltransferase